MTQKKLVNIRAKQIRRKFGVDFIHAKKLAKALLDTPFVFMDMAKDLGYNLDINLDVSYYYPDMDYQVRFVIDGFDYPDIQTYLCKPGY